MQTTILLSSDACLLTELNGPPSSQNRGCACHTKLNFQMVTAKISLVINRSMEQTHTRYKKTN